jgi:membrane-associated phospholipid phosphatase
LSQSNQNTLLIKILKKISKKTLLTLIATWLLIQPVNAQDYPNVIEVCRSVQSFRFKNIKKTAFNIENIYIGKIDDYTTKFPFNVITVLTSQNPLTIVKIDILSRNLQQKIKFTAKQIHVPSSPAIAGFALNDNNLKSVKSSRNLLHETDFTVKQLYIPTSLIIAGLALNGNSPKSLKNKIVEERNRYMPNFRIHIDDYMQFSPAVIAYGLDVFGVKSKNDFLNRTAIFLKGEVGMLAVTHFLKNITHIRRPDNSGYNSFPSGHTAQAFAAATFLSEEYKHKFKWIPYISYGVATLVGILRMANNKHYISDVLAGAGIGYLSMKIAYWTHQYKWNKNKRLLREVTDFRRRIIEQRLP